jgi:phosphoribosylaminoimidazole (AIR) synthetase
VPEAELCQVFNMGIGMTLFVAAGHHEAILKQIAAHNLRAWTIGEVAKGSGKARLE